MLWKRCASGAVMIVILAVLLYTGGTALGIGICIVSLCGQYEYYRAVGVASDGKPFNALTVPAYIATIALYIRECLLTNDSYIFGAICALLVIALLGVMVIDYPKVEHEVIARAFFGFIYVSVMLSFIFGIRNMNGGVYLVWMVFIASSVCDLFAYFFGMLLGKHRLAPVLSPKKSIEGAVAGSLCAALVGLGYGIFTAGRINTNMNPVIVFPIMALLASVVAQIGDLAASAIKRQTGIKDYGKLIPGHGGILDRVDSIILTAPIVFVVLKLAGC